MGMDTRINWGSFAFRGMNISESVRENSLVYRVINHTLCRGKGKCLCNPVSLSWAPSLNRFWEFGMHGFAQLIQYLQLLPEVFSSTVLWLSTLTKKNVLQESQGECSSDICGQSYALSLFTLCMLKTALTTFPLPSLYKLIPLWSKTIFIHIYIGIAILLHFI